MTQKFRAEPQHLLPEVATLVLAGVLSVVVISSQIEVETLTAFPETPTGATLNTVIYVATMAVVATLMYLLIKYGLERVFRLVLKFAVVLVSFALVNWYSNAFLTLAEIPSGPSDAISIFATIILTALLSYIINRMSGALQIVAVTALGAMIGTFLGASIPTMTAAVLMLGLSIYDVLAVFRGPIKKIAERTELENLSGATFTYRDLTVGLGDIVFYSMLASHAMFSFGHIAYLTTSLGVMGGTFLGFKMLEKREMFPGLPLSLITGLAFMLATASVQGLLNL